MLTVENHIVYLSLFSSVVAVFFRPSERSSSRGVRSCFNSFGKERADSLNNISNVQTTLTLQLILIPLEKKGIHFSYVKLYAL